MGDALSAIGLLLVFAGAFTDMMERSVQNLLNTDKPSGEEKDASKRLIGDFRQAIYARSIPLTTSMTVVCYLLLPETVSILRASELSVWNFDLANTLYVCIHIGVVTFTFITYTQLVRLVKRLRKIRK